MLVEFTTSVIIYGVFYRNFEIEINVLCFFKKIHNIWSCSFGRRKYNVLFDLLFTKINDNEVLKTLTRTPTYT